MNETDLKDSVAAHQAECGCHPVNPKENEDEERDDEQECFECEKVILADACDSSGNPWHVDPLCKVRPEAKV